MKKSILLHSLSLKDRMLEPNKLPLHGRVWGYAKEKCSRDAFIGHCLTMLSLFGMHASDISLKKRDIVAFDAERAGDIYTIVISLQDDSLASNYFYFLGIWQQPDPVSSVAPLPLPPEDSDLLTSDFQYEVSFEDTPLKQANYGDMIGGGIFAGKLYDGEICLAGDTLINRQEISHFVITPAKTTSELSRNKVRHVLYSLRNIMALIAACMRLHDQIWSTDDEMELYGDAMNLMRKARMEEIRDSEWDRLVMENGEALLRASELSMLRTRQNSDARNLDALFDSIISELNSHPMPGMQPIWPRLHKPFELTKALLNERIAILKRSSRQCEILLDLLHSRMLAHQQVMLSTMLTR